MTSRERVLRAFHKMSGKADRPPLQFDLCRSLTDHFAKKLGMTADYAESYYEDLTYRISANAIRTTLGSDVVVVGGTVAESFQARPDKDGCYENEFGMVMKPTDLYMEVIKAPLSGTERADQVREYPFPDPNAPGRFVKAKRDIERYKDSHFIIGDVELTIFELAWHLVGMEEYMIAFAMEEEWIDLLNDRVEEWSLGLAKQLVEAGVDAIWFGEDLGTQNSMLISPDMWRTRLKPRYLRMIGELRRINPDVMIIMHSDGAVAPLIDDFIEMGIDIYNPVQPNVPGSDPAELADKYGGRISFFGGIDQQQLLPEGDTGEMKAELQSRAQILGSDGGYLMAPAHIIQADTAPETVEKMIEIITKL